MEKTELETKEFWKTKSRGTNEDEYRIYTDCAKSLGWKILSFDEWMEK